MKTEKDKIHELHIGSMIEAELRRQRRSASWFADELCCDRTNVYKIFHKENIDAGLLFRISQILSYDFFRCYSKVLNTSEFPPLAGKRIKMGAYSLNILLMASGRKIAA